MTDPRTDHQLAADLAREAGEVLLGIRGDFPADGEPAQLKSAGDLGSHEYLMAALATARPGDAVLSEEGADDRARLSAERVWIVDPLDGTREFSERPRDDWAVHVALWEAGASSPARSRSRRAVSCTPPPSRTRSPPRPAARSASR